LRVTRVERELSAEVFRTGHWNYGPLEPCWMEIRRLAVPVTVVEGECCALESLVVDYAFVVIRSRRFLS